MTAASTEDTLIPHYARRKLTIINFSPLNNSAQRAIALSLPPSSLSLSHTHTHINIHTPTPTHPHTQMSPGYSPELCVGQLDSSGNR